MSKLDDQISTLQQRLTQLKLRQAHVDARKRSIEAERDRKRETRRRILVGALILSKAEAGQFDSAQLRTWLDQSLERADDRALFGLRPRQDAIDSETMNSR